MKQVMIKVTQILIGEDNGKIPPFEFGGIITHHFFNNGTGKEDMAFQVCHDNGILDA